eukprot:1161632-Pelagomonas_calceolata.AAC.6
MQRSHHTCKDHTHLTKVTHAVITHAKHKVGGNSTLECCALTGADGRCSTLHTAKCANPQSKIVSSFCDLINTLKIAESHCYPFPPGVAPEEPTAEELAGATAAAEPPLPEQMEQAHIAGAASPASGAMMSDAAAMTPRQVCWKA